MTPDVIPHVVFDCNVYAQCLISPSGPAAKCVECALKGRVGLFWSEYVLREIQRIPEKPTPMRMGVIPSRVEALIARLSPLAHLVENVPTIYTHPLDPKDSHYVNLAIATDASFLVSRDKNPRNLMIPLKLGSADFLRTCPKARVLTPDDLLNLLHASPHD